MNGNVEKLQRLRESRKRSERYGMKEKYKENSARRRRNCQRRIARSPAEESRVKGNRCFYTSRRILP